MEKTAGMYVQGEREDVQRCISTNQRRDLNNCGSDSLVSYAALFRGGPMWNKKKSVAPQAANSVPTNLQTNQPTKLAPSFGEGTTKRNKDVMHPTGAMVERATSRLGSNLH